MFYIVLEAPPLDKYPVFAQHEVGYPCKYGCRQTRKLDVHRFLPVLLAQQPHEPHEYHLRDKYRRRLTNYEPASEPSEVARALGRKHQFLAKEVHHRLEQ